MPFFRKKPVVIEAVQLRTRVEAESQEGICTGGPGCEGGGPDGAYPHVHTLEGDHTWTPGDWLITGVKGERYFCKPDIFAATYEPAGRETSGTDAAPASPNVCACGHTHLAGSDGEDEGCCDGECDCWTWRAPSSPATTPPCGGSRCRLSDDETHWIHSSKSYSSCAVHREAGNTDLKFTSGRATTPPGSDE